MEMPEVPKCFGVFPPRYACYLIALFGLGSGGIGLAGIILYGLLETSILGHFIESKTRDESVKKVILLTIGLSSLLLCAANTLLFLGTISKSRGAVLSAMWVTLAMCMLLITGTIAAPMSCFFMETMCLIKKVSFVVMVLGFMSVTLFLQLWLYFTVVMYSFSLDL